MILESKDTLISTYHCIFLPYCAIMSGKRGACREQAENRLYRLDPKPDLDNANVGIYRTQHIFLCCLFTDMFGRTCPFSFSGFVHGCSPYDTRSESQVYNQRKGAKIMLGTCLDQVRTFVPLVHNITNYVTVNDVANVLLAGRRLRRSCPTMPDDVEDITSDLRRAEPEHRHAQIRDSIAANVPRGTTAQRSWASIRSCSTPVGAGASRLRTEHRANRLMEERAASTPCAATSPRSRHSRTWQRQRPRAWTPTSVDAVTEANLDDGVAARQRLSRSGAGCYRRRDRRDRPRERRRAHAACIRNGRRGDGPHHRHRAASSPALMTAFLAANPDHKLAAAAAAVAA